MKKFKNAVTKTIDELRERVAYQESILTQMRYSIEEMEKVIGPIILEAAELRKALRKLMIAVMAKESALRNHDRESVDLSGQIEAARLMLEGGHTNEQNE